jgi:16S rRNA (cytidine1402-2'-O)-methyltransferase
MSGTLYLVATPIGNLEDITLRALRVLGEADLIACEDTRHTRKLLAHYEIFKPITSYHEHNERKRAAELISKLEAGMNIAIVSDAGTPLVSDPGFHIVREAIERGLQVIPIPGPSAFIAALAASGLPTDQFTFVGFLPSKPSTRRKRLAELAQIESTLIIYEAPHRIKETISDAAEVLGNRTCVIAREMTKIHEEFIRGLLAEINLPDTTMRGEMVLLIGPPASERIKEVMTSFHQSITEEVSRMVREKGLDQKSALKQVARLRRISKSAAYRLLLDERAAGEVE